MAAGIPASFPSVTQDLSVSEVLRKTRDTGDITHRSIHLLSTQILEQGSKELPSFYTRALGVFAGIIEWVWTCMNSLLGKAVPEASKKTDEQQLTLHVITCKKTNLTIQEKLSAFKHLIESSYELLDRCSKQRALAIHIKIQNSYNELPDSLKNRLEILLQRDTGKLIEERRELNINNLDERISIINGIDQIYHDLNSVVLAKYAIEFSTVSTNKEKVNLLLKVMDITLSELDPDITETYLQSYVLRLFDSLEDSVQQEIYREVQAVILPVNGAAWAGSIMNNVYIRASCPDFGSIFLRSRPCESRVRAGLRSWLEKFS